MKTISAHFNTHNHGTDPSISTEKSYRMPRYDEYDNHAAGDMNRNASVSQAEFQRNACEEELYRLRFGIERLLAANEQGDFGGRQRQRNGFGQNPFRRMMSRTKDLLNRRNKSWFERCTPCCRRGRRDRYNDNGDIHNAYAYRDGYNDGLSPGGTPKSPSQVQHYSDSFGSGSPSPSGSSRYMDRNISPTESQLGRMASRSFDDPAYQSIILKILEAKALDCVCKGYSKEKTQKQISQALAELNQRSDGHQWDSASVTSSRLSSSSYDSSRTGSNESISSAPGSPQLYSPSPFSMQTPNQSQTSGLSPSSNRTKSSLRSKGRKKRSKSKSNVADKTPSSSTSRRKKRTSSKHRKKSNKKPSRSKRSNRKASQSKRSSRKASRSKRSNQKRSKSRTSRKKSASSKSRKKSTSSKTRSKKTPSKSPSRSKTRRKRKSKGKKRSRKKRTKAKSNNQVNDQEAVKLPIFMYPSIYQKVYENRQRLLKLLLSSTS